MNLQLQLQASLLRIFLRHHWADPTSAKLIGTRWSLVFAAQGSFPLKLHWIRPGFDRTEGINTAGKARVYHIDVYPFKLLQNVLTFE